MTTCRRPAATQQSRGRTPSGWAGCRWERDREWGGTPLAASRDWLLQGYLGPLSPSTSGQRSTDRDVWLWVPPEAATARQLPGAEPVGGEQRAQLYGGRPSAPAAEATAAGADGGGGEITPFGGSMTLFLSSATHFGGAAAPVMNPVLEAIFGNRTAAWVLLFLQCYGEGHALRIAKTFDFGLNMTQRQLKRLEEEGVLVSRLVGNIRLFSFNDRNPTVRNLKELLEAELKLLPNEQVQHYFRERQRPRQSGKALVHHG